MLTPFNGYKYLIKEVKASEANKLLKLAEHLNLKVTYPHLFSGDKDIYRIHISDNHLGGYVSSMIAYYGKYRYFPNFNELRLHVIRMNMRKEHPLLMYSYEEYSKYLDSLSEEGIKHEGDVVGGIISLLDSYYVPLKEIEQTYLNLEEVPHIDALVDQLDELFLIDIYLYYPNHSGLVLDNKESLLHQYLLFHDENGEYSKLKQLTESFRNALRRGKRCLCNY